VAVSRRVRIGLGADPDDAFMWYALAAGRVRAPGVTPEWVVEDVEALNRRARAAELEVTAISSATYLLVADRYRLTDAGAALATAGGPVLVAREPVAREALEQRVVAIPGKHTTAALLLRLYVGDPPLIEVAFEKIPRVVREGQADVGLLIHEGPLVETSGGLVTVLDLGEAWRRETGLPLPLGVNVVRRDLPEDLQRAVADGLRESIAWARAHEDEALAHAMRHARGMDRETCRRFVRALVGDGAASLGADGRAALARLCAEAHRRGLVEASPPVDPV
jgi:1,4-dihydroxy-6-naphthoate synthase